MLSPSTLCATLAGFSGTSTPFLRAGVPIGVTPSKNSVDWCYVIRDCHGIELDSFWLIPKPYPDAFSWKLENCQTASSSNTKPHIREDASPRPHAARNFQIICIVHGSVSAVITTSFVYEPFQARWLAHVPPVLRRVRKTAKSYF